MADTIIHGEHEHEYEQLLARHTFLYGIAWYSTWY
jgi:hypothetical protein